MIYSIALLFLFATIIALRYTSRRSLLLATMVLLLDITIFSVVLYIAKCGNYPYPSSSLMMLDYKGYMLLSKLRIPFYWVIRMQNIGLSGFLICMPFALNVLGVNRKRKWLDFVLLIIPVGYMIFFDPSLRLNIFFFLYSQPSDKFELYRRMIMYASSICNFCIIGYMFIPIVRLILASRSSSLLFKKKQLISIIVSLLFLDIICVFIFVQNPFGHLFDQLSVSSLLGFQENYMTVLNNHYIYIWLPVLILIASNVMLISLMRVSTLDEFNMLHSYLMKKKSLEANKNMQGIFHSFKNVIFSVNIIAKQLEMEQDHVKREALVRRLKQLSENNLEHMSTVLNVYKNPSIYISEHDVTKCLDRVIERRNVGESIQISREYTSGTYAICDAYVLEEIISNIIENAEDAIRLSDREQGRIKITVTNEYEWVVLRITDNGNGIPKKHLKKVFKAFRNTRSRKKSSFIY